MARKSKQKTAGPDVRVKMVAPHSYKLDARSKRHLPKGWSGLVPEAIADEIEAAGTGARDVPFEIIDGKGSGMKAGKSAKAAGNSGAGTDGTSAGAGISTDPAPTDLAAATSTTEAGDGAASASGSDAGAREGGTTDLLDQGGAGED